MYALKEISGCGTQVECTQNYVSHLFSRTFFKYYHKEFRNSDLIGFFMQTGGTCFDIKMAFDTSNLEYLLEISRNMYGDVKFKLS